METERYQKILKILSAVFRSQSTPQTSDRFEKNVMRRIRRLASEKNLGDDWVLFQPAIWRFSTAAACIALVMAVYVFQTGFLPEYEMAEIFLESSEELSQAFPF